MDRRRSVRLTAASASSGRRFGSVKISVAVHRDLREFRTAENDILVKTIVQYLLHYICDVFLNVLFKLYFYFSNILLLGRD